MRLEKNHYGWSAKTEYPLEDLGVEGVRVLTLSTSKAISGLLCTNVSAAIEIGNSRVFIMFQDYNKRLATTGIRCTEKNVRVQQTLCERDIDTYIAEAKQHYAVQKQ